MVSAGSADKGLSVSIVGPGISQLPWPDPPSVPGVDMGGGQWWGAMQLLPEQGPRVPGFCFSKERAQ